jgi:glycosyltransferase involved in cell wall biosynthesis
MVLHGEDGLLTEESPERFAAAVIKLLQDRPLYERMSRCARHNAAALSAGAAAEKMIDRYAELLEIRRPSPIPHQPI